MAEFEALAPDVQEFRRLLDEQKMAIYDYAIALKQVEIELERLNQMAVRLYLAGFTWEIIAGSFGISRQALHKRLVAAGLNDF